jgi:hypothetical protein
VRIEHLTSFDDLVAWLDQSKVQYRVDKATQIAEVLVDGPPPLTGSLWLKWGSPYVQVDHPFVLDVPEDRVRAIETAIVRANNIIAMPGLGFDYERRAVHMRVAIPMYDDGMAEPSFKAQVFAALANAKDFVAAFKAIADGKPGEQVMQLALEALQKQPNAQA